MPRNHTIRNQTPNELVLSGTPHFVKLAPLQRRTVGGDPEELFGLAASAARCDQAVDWEIEPVRSRRLLYAAWLVGAGICALFGGLLGSLAAGARIYAALGVAAAVVLAGAAVKILSTGGGSQASATQQMATRVLDPEPIRSDLWELVRDFLIAATQALAIVVMVCVAVAAPALAIYYGTELSGVVAFDGWRHVTLSSGKGDQYIVVARVLQLVLIIIVSTVPALMYFQFDREKRSTLVDRWLHAIFRLDPSVRTVADVDAKYGRRVEEFFGASLSISGAAPRGRFRTRSPVIITTLLIAIGWIVVLLNNDQARTANPTVQELFRPSPTPMTLAFLGGYFLAVQVALRGYVRGDLKAKSYNVITVRLLIAVILAWVMEALWGSTAKWVLGASFFAGLTPTTVLRQIRDIVNRLKTTVGSIKPAADDELKVQSPLTGLDEVDVYERTRLEEEGITSVQALARHDLIDLMLSSRIPVPRLVDWVDQAILLQHAPTMAPAMRKLHIRNATDFLRLCEDDPETLARVKEALSAGPDPVEPEILVKVLNGDEWLRFIRNWRTNDGTETVVIRIYDALGGSRTMTRPANQDSPSFIDLRTPAETRADAAGKTATQANIPAQQDPSAPSRHTAETSGTPGR
jgi:hypothetical protein